MRTKTETQLLKEIRQLRREKLDLEIQVKGLERRYRLAEKKADYLNGLLKATDETIQTLKEDLEHARSLNERLP